MLFFLLKEFVGVGSVKLELYREGFSSLLLLSVELSKLNKLDEFDLEAGLW